jgi:DNA replication protein DnaC
MNQPTLLPPLLERLHTQLHDLALHEADALVESHLERAARDTATYADFLTGLLAEELSARGQRALSMRMQLAGLPRGKTLANFDFAFQPSVDERLVRELATLRFVHEAHNVILLGPPGVGKTHLAAGLAAEAVRGGFSAYFTTAHDLTGLLGRAAREGKLEARMKTYLRPRVLVVDEGGYLPLDEVGANLLFQLISARYEKGSILLTSNKNYGQWGAIFGESTIAAALLDRLLHHSTTLNIRGDSYRLKDRKRAGLLTSSPPASSQRGEGGGSGVSKVTPHVETGGMPNGDEGDL